MTYGATDEFGYNAVEKVVTVHDLHATMLHLLGVDHERLTFRFQGRDFRLTDVTRDGGEGRVGVTSCDAVRWTGVKRRTITRTSRSRKRSTRRSRDWRRPLGEATMSPSEDRWFDHEKLDVYRESLVFVGWLSGLLETVLRAGDVKDHLDRTADSIVLNIAEGNGKYAPKDRCRFFDTAHGSAASNAPLVWTSWLQNRN